MDLLRLVLSKQSLRWLCPDDGSAFKLRLTEDGKRLQWTGEEIPAFPDDLNPIGRYIYHKTLRGGFCNRSWKTIPEKEVYFYRCLFLRDPDLYAEATGDKAGSYLLLKELMEVPLEIAEITVLIWGSILSSDQLEDTLNSEHNCSAMSSLAKVEQMATERSISGALVLKGYREGKSGCEPKFMENKMESIYYLHGWRLATDSIPDWPKDHLFLGGLLKDPEFPSTKEFAEMVDYLCSSNAIPTTLSHLPADTMEILWRCILSDASRVERIVWRIQCVTRRSMENMQRLLDSGLTKKGTHLYHIALAITGSEIENLDAVIESTGSIASLMISVCHPQIPPIGSRRPVQPIKLPSTFTYCPVEHGRVWFGDKRSGHIQKLAILISLRAWGRLDEIPYLNAIFRYLRIAS